MNALHDITPTWGHGANAFVTGKLVRHNNRSVRVEYIGEWIDAHGRPADAWQTTSFGQTYVRIEPRNDGRARWHYDAGHDLADEIKKANRP